MSLLFAAAMLVYFGFSEWGYEQHLKVALTWPVVDGRITVSSLRKDCSKGSRFTPMIVYSYTTQGASYDGNIATFKDLPCDDESKILAVLKRFPVDGTVQVHVNPQNPSESLVYFQ